MISSVFSLLSPHGLKAAYYEKAKNYFLIILISYISSFISPAEFIFIVPFLTIYIYTQANVNIYIYIASYTKGGIVKQSSVPFVFLSWRSFFISIQRATSISKQ